MSDPQFALFRQQQLQEAAPKIVELREVLHGVWEGERIWKEHTS